MPFNVGSITGYLKLDTKGWTGAAKNAKGDMDNLGKKAKNDDGTRYLPIKVQSASKPVYLHDGIDVTDAVQAFIPKKSAPKTQANLDNKVIWRTVSLNSIVKVRMLGAEHTIEG